jgi:hypothetical protein
MVTIAAADLGSWLAIVSLGLTFLLWGVDKMFEAAESKFEEPQKKPWQQKAQKVIKTIWAPAKFVVGFVMAAYGLYIFYALWASGLLSG